MAAIVPAAAETGAAIGTILAGPVGTIVGFVAGGAVGIGLTSALYFSGIFKSKAEDARKEAI